MSNETKSSIAYVYAKALLELAIERDLVQSLREELEELRILIHGERELALFLESPSIRTEQKIESMKRIFGSNVSELMLDFLCVLATRDRLALLEEIPLSYAKLDDERQGYVSGTVTTAVELSEEELSEITERVCSILNQKVRLKSIVDPAIIGGIILQVEDTVMDNSLSCSLRRFEKDFDRMLNQPQGFAADYMD